jgi:hypothetical protein
MPQLKSGIVVKKTEEVDREKKKKKMKPGAEHPLRHSLKGKYVGIRGEKRKASKKR